jgi:hypothetical protein
MDFKIGDTVMYPDEFKNVQFYMVEGLTLLFLVLRRLSTLTFTTSTESITTPLFIDITAPLPVRIMKTKVQPFDHAKKYTRSISGLRVLEVDEV